MKRKYAILVGDGMADFPIAEIDNKTPLEYAKTPHMDAVVQQGRIGLVATVPDTMSAGSDVANMSLLGYNPRLYYSGRAPIEAASMGIDLGPNDVAFRCNLVTLIDGKMADYSAGHIDTSDGVALIRELQDSLSTESIRFYPGISYRHLVVITGLLQGLDCTPPHDISDQEFGPYLPDGPGSDILLSLMEKAHTILASSDINALRLEEGKRPATDIWFWGGGKACTFPTIKDRFSITGSVISAVDLVRGLGVLAGLRVRIVEGATGYLGTNYEGKIAAAKEALVHEDFLYLHVEAPDETSHEGSLEKKIQAIEEFDRFIVGPMLAFQKETEHLTILVAPDHATPISTRTHHAGPIPYAVCGEGITAGNATGYNEPAAKGQPILTGEELFAKFIKGNL